MSASEEFALTVGTLLERLQLQELDVSENFLGDKAALIIIRNRSIPVLKLQDNMLTTRFLN